MRQLRLSGLVPRVVCRLRLAQVPRQCTGIRVAEQVSGLQLPMALLGQFYVQLHQFQRTGACVEEVLPTVLQFQADHLVKGMPDLIDELFIGLLFGLVRQW